MPVTNADDFAQLAERYRPELSAYCYRMLGSIDECEDLVQETYLRAWRSYDRFEGRSSVRLWLYKIATTTYLTALQTRKRRPLPSGLSAPADSAGVRLAAPQPDIPWLQPAPDSLLYGATDDPAVVVSRRETVRLAFIAALQHLSPCNARCWCCATSLPGTPKKSPRCWTPPPWPSTAHCSAPAHNWHRPAQSTMRSANQPNPRCGTCSTAIWQPSNTPTSTRSPSCFEPTSNSKCLRFQPGSPDAMRCADSWARQCSTLRINGG